ncbi:MAG: hypothetical protein K2Y26_00165 [Gemmatimonadaceae bacterium]|nr:hypothetical protein [Gemmatimonadaceae bacterium]
MRPVAPRTGAPEITIAEEQEEYKPITIAVYQYSDGSRGLLTRYTFTAEERAAIARGEDVYIMQLNFGGGFTPQIVECGPGSFTVPA